MPVATIEILPGDIWENHGIRHKGLRAEVIRDGGPRVKVKVIRSEVDTHGMVGRLWQVPREVLLTHWHPVKAAVADKPKVETDLQKLVAQMPLAPPALIKEAIDSVKLDGQTQVVENPGMTVLVARPAHPEREAEEARVDDAAELERVRWQQRWDALHSDAALAKRRRTFKARVDALTPDQRDIIKRLRQHGSSIRELAAMYKLDMPHMGALVAELTGVDSNTVSYNKRLKKPKPIYAAEPVLTKAEKLSVVMHKTLESQYAALSEGDKALIVADYLSLGYREALRKYGLINGVLKKVLVERGIRTYSDQKKQGTANHRQGQQARRERERAEKARAAAGEKPEEALLRHIFDTPLRKTKAEQVVSNVALVPLAPTGATFYARVAVMQLVTQTIALDAPSLEDALALARAYPGVASVGSVWEQDATPQ